MKYRPVTYSSVYDVYLLKASGLFFFSGARLALQVYYSCYCDESKLYIIIIPFQMLRNTSTHGQRGEKISSRLLTAVRYNSLDI